MDDMVIVSPPKKHLIMSIWFIAQPWCMCVYVCVFSLDCLLGEMGATVPCTLLSFACPLSLYLSLSLHGLDLPYSWLSAFFSSIKCFFSHRRCCSLFVFVRLSVCFLFFFGSSWPWLKYFLFSPFDFPGCRPLLPTLINVCCGKFLVWGFFSVS